MSLAEPGKSTAVLAVDTGGTFTDFVLLEGGELRTLKLPSNPDDPSRPVLEGVARILGGATLPGLVLIHGSTVATNAILERKGARVVLITNAGFEDVLEIARQDRPQLYALTGHRPPPLVDRHDRIGIRGRIDADGTELVPIDVTELRTLAARVVGAEAIAVSLLHSYANPAHEEAVADALGSLADAPLSLSSRVLPEFREFERTSTTVANAYVAPLVAGYLDRLSRGSPASRIRVMGSSGGALSLARAIEEPVHTVLSGPAGGVVAALEWGRRLGYREVLSFDMGGTSTDVSLISGGLRHTREGKVGEIPIAVPLLDIHTVGAGGGSIAKVDPGGALRVGPESAGSRPGPIAYGHGGRRVTVTDAHVWLGRLPEISFLGGDVPLHRNAIQGPLEALARETGMDPDRVAEGVLDVANAAMERALRVISVERGVDPSGFHLVAFGGAAGLHAADLTHRLGLRGVLIPPDPGLLSAYGMLVAPIVRDRARTTFLSSNHPEEVERIPRVLDELEAEARREMVSEEIAGRAITVTRWIDARYHDQSFELRVPAESWVEGFHRAHDERFGYRRESVPVEAVTLRVRAESSGEEVPVPHVVPSSGAPPETRCRATWMGRRVDARVISREALIPNDPVEGPAVIVEYSATTWCPPGWRVERDRLGVLRLTPQSHRPR
jgi:N-methylhydantoinase A